MSPSGRVSSLETRTSIPAGPKVSGITRTQMFKCVTRSDSERKETHFQCLVPGPMYYSLLRICHHTLAIVSMHILHPGGQVLELNRIFIFSDLALSPRLSLVVLLLY